MDVTSRNGGEGESSSDVGIPTGLNRIKTRRVSSKDQQPSSRPDESVESPSFWVSRSPLRQKQKTMAQGGRERPTGPSRKSRFAFSCSRGLILVLFSLSSVWLLRKCWNRKRKLLFFFYKRKYTV